MDGVGPGTQLGGRYHVQRRVSQDGASTTWQALDETLDRPVSVRVIDREHPRATEVVDAARRAAGVEDSRLLRVLDVGSEDTATYVVSEWVEGESLPSLLRGGALPPDEVRRLIGEAATALEAARHRGLHHLVLTPRCLVRSSDGSVVVLGLAVDAALAGIDESDPARATGTDTRSLVALAYAGLTGRWPLDRIADLEPPPRVGPGIPPPSELASGVPADLDTLCRETLGAGLGPADPGALAAQIAPWPAGPVVGPSRAGGAFPLSLGGQPADATTLLPAVSTPSGTTPAPAVPPRAATAPGVASPFPGASAAAPPAEPPAAVSQPWAMPPPPPRSLAADPAPPSPAPALPMPPAPTPAPAPAPAPSAFTQLGDAEPPAPLLPATSMARPPQAQTRAVLAVVALFVVVLLVLAYYGLKGLGSGSSGDSTNTGSNPTATGTARPSSSTSPSSSAPPATTKLKIVGATGFDPQGDGSEDDSLAPKAYDKNPSTGWTSDTYRTTNWGGLKKGVGLRLDLGSPQVVHSATLTIGGTGAVVQLRAVSGSSLTGSTVLASRSNASGTFTLTAGTPTSTRYVVIWFTTPGTASGGYRAEVDNVVLR